MLELLDRQEAVAPLKDSPGGVGIRRRTPVQPTNEAPVVRLIPGHAEFGFTMVAISVFGRSDRLLVAFAAGHWRPLPGPSLTLPRSYCNPETPELPELHQRASFRELPRFQPVVIDSRPGVPAPLIAAVPHCGMRPGTERLINQHAY